MAAKIGSLRADVTLETGRFKAGAADLQAATAAIRNNFKATSREIRTAANDMGMSVQGFSRDLAALKTQLNPLSAAQAAYRREVDLARKGLSLGALSGKEYGQAMVDAARKLNSFRASLKDLSDGGATKLLAADIAALQARLNPAAAALAAYKAEMRLLQGAAKQGAISQAELITGVKAATATYRAAGAEVNRVNGNSAAGMQQLGYNLNDMATMWGMGARPMQIFASQAGQTVQAIGLMTQGAGKFGAFMAGPWGIAIVAGISVLAALIPALMKTEDAMKDVELASNGLSDAQGVLGEMFDLTTGKLKNQNEMLRLNAQLMAINLRAQASQQRASSEDAMRNFQTGNLGLSMGQKALGALGVPVSDAMARNDQVRTLIRQYQNKQIDAGIALRAGEKLDFSGLAITKQEFMQAVSDGVAAPLKEDMAAKIEKSLAEGVLDPSLRQDAKTKAAKKAPKGPSMETGAEQAAELAALDREYLQAKLSVATSADERADLEWELLAIERDRRLKDVDADKKLTEAQRNERKAAIERIYGSTPKDGALVVVGNSPEEVKLRREQAAREADLANDMLSRQADTLQSLAEIEPDTKKRAALEKEALDIQQEIQRTLLEQQIANGQIADADKARALQAQQQAAQQERLRIQNMSPGQRYAYDLRTSISDMNAALQNIQVGGLQTLEDSLAQVATGAKSVGAAFRDMTSQVIGELARLAIRKAIITPLANALFGKDKGGDSASKLITASGTMTAASAALGVSATAWMATSAAIKEAAAALASSGGGGTGGGGGVLGGLVSGIGNLFGGGGGGAFAGAGSYDFSAFSDISVIPGFARGTKFAPGGLALIGEHGPELLDLPRGSQVIPNHELASMGGSAGQGDTNNYYYGPGAEEFWGQVDSRGAGQANRAIAVERRHDVRKAGRKLGKAAK